MTSDPARAETSRVATIIDYDKDGKQVSFLGVPISTDESAYGTVTVPITVVKNGTGPTLYFSGGVHGDEFEGPVALMKLARELEPGECKGGSSSPPASTCPRCSPASAAHPSTG